MTINNLHPQVRVLIEKGRRYFPGINYNNIESLHELEKIMSIGFSIEDFDDKIHELGLLKKAKKEIIKTGSISNSTMTEITTLGLLSKLGNLVVSEVPRNSGRTPDFIGSLNGIEVEVEATAASAKKLQWDRAGIFSEIAGKLREIKKCSEDWVIYIGSKYKESSFNEINKFFKENSGTRKSVDFPGIFSASIIDPAMPPNAIMIGGYEDIKPSWYIHTDELLNQVSMSCVLNGASDQLGQIRVRYQTSIIGYTNPITNKMKEFQGSGLRPFIIFLNISALPRAIDYYQKNIMPLIERYPMLSGLIVYSLHMYNNEYGYTFQVFENKNALFKVDGLIPDIYKSKEGARLSFKIFNVDP